MLILNRLIYVLVRLFGCTFRYRFHNPEILTELKGRYLLAVWHQNLFAGILAQTGTKHVVIVSKSKDAEPVAYTCEQLGHQVARGSSRSKDGRDKGGRAAMLEMTEYLKEGLPGAVTVDGPKGPAKKVKAGIINMAKEAGIPIVPYRIIPRSFWQFKSWDLFRLPKPFSIIDVTYGEPIDCQDKDLEKLSQDIENALNLSN